MSKLEHTPVLVKEVLAALNPKGEDRLLDATLGLGGHTAAYLKAGGDNTTAVGIELDEAALTQARTKLAPFGSRVTYIQGSYHEAKDLITGGEILSPDNTLFTHILLDLGFGSHQLTDASRGFSFGNTAGLSMRYSSTGSLPPASVPALNRLQERLGRTPDVPDLLQYLSREELAQIIRTYGEEKFAGRIAKKLTDEASKFQSAADIAAAVTEAVPGMYRHGRINPATRTFQALRLAVNRELEVLTAALPQLVQLLKPQGKIAVISFHSLEDRIVKRFFQAQAKGCICPPSQPICTCGHTPTLTILTKKPVEAGEEEVQANPRSRSAKMRVAQKRDS